MRDSHLDPSFRPRKTDPFSHPECASDEDESGREEEHDDDKPLDQSADKGTRVHRVACAVNYLLDTGAAERMIDFDSLDSLHDDAAQERANEPADDEDNNGEQQVRDVVNSPPQQVIKGLLKHGDPIRNVHIEI